MGFPFPPERTTVASSSGGIASTRFSTFSLAVVRPFFTHFWSSYLVSSISISLTRAGESRVHITFVTFV